MKQAFMITDSIYREGVGGGGDDRGIMGDNGKDIYCIAVLVKKCSNIAFLPVK